MNEGSGHPKYEEEILISLFLYAYYKKITSFREIEELARNDLGVMWLTGMHYPDHNTIWQFYHRNHKGLKNLFKHTVKMSMNMGLIGLDNVKTQWAMMCSVINLRKMYNGAKAVG